MKKLWLLLVMVTPQFMHSQEVKHAEKSYFDRKLKCIEYAHKREKEYFVKTPLDPSAPSSGEFTQVEYSPSRDSCVAAGYEAAYNGFIIWDVQDILTNETLWFQVCMPKDSKEDVCIHAGDKQKELMKQLAAPTAKAAK